MYKSQLIDPIIQLLFLNTDRVVKKISALDFIQHLLHSHILEHILRLTRMTTSTLTIAIIVQHLDLNITFYLAGLNTLITTQGFCS